MAKIIHMVLGKANPDRLNGVNKVVYSLAMQQAIETNRPVAVWGFTPQPDNSAAPFPLQQFIHAPYAWTIPDDVKEAIRAEPTGTIFHIHGGLTPLFYLLARFLKSHNRNYVVTLHGCLLPQSLQRGFWYKYPYILLCERWLLKHAASVHCITAQERRHIKRLAPKATTVLIPNGATPVENLVFSGAPDTTHGIRFLYMGRFALVHKGLDKLIEAFAIFQQAHRNSYLFLAGSGNDLTQLQNLINRYNVKHYVRILPPHFHDEKTRLMQNADIFIHTSRWDVMPTSCLEAAAHGKPLLVTQATGLSPYIEKYQAGWIIRTLTVTEIAQRMTDAYQAWYTGRTVKMEQNAIQMIRSELNWPMLAQRFYSDIYDHVAA